MFNLRASVFSYYLVIALVLGGFFYEIARGQDGSPYSLIGAVGGIGCIAQPCSCSAGARRLE